MRLSARSDPLPAEHGAAREESLASGAHVPVVVDELERPLAQLEDGHIGRGADIERATIAEHLEHARRVDGRARDRLIERMPKSRNFDSTFGKSMTCDARPSAVQSVEKVSGQKPACMTRSTMSHLR